MNASTDRHDPTTDALIVGGGIGGLGAALALARQGVRVRVSERADTFGEVGAGLQIAPNCTRILANYELLDEARDRGVTPNRIVMRDALDGTVLTWLDGEDLERTYGAPYLVMHRSDLHAMLLRACEQAGVDLRTGQEATGYESDVDRARVHFVDGHVEEAQLVVAADGLHSVARQLLVDDEPVNSAYVAYRGAVPIEQVRDNGVSETDVVVYVGPKRHFVQYPLRGGEMFNQVAVFESPRARAGEENWGGADELDAAFAGSCEQVQRGLPLMWRDRCWRMFDREPIASYVHRRIALLGDAAHPPLQYMAQGAVMALEDGWVLGEHVRAQAAADRARAAGIDWDVALAAYDAVRPEHCRRVVEATRAWGDLWHLDGLLRLQRNALFRSRHPHDHAFTDWIYRPTALTPDQEPEMYRTIPLSSVDAPADDPTAQASQAAGPTSGALR